ncbi:MAG: AAA-like domain-containing protein [Acidobacteria bacterium]|nr:AAA-like domain-containing protein [Acidobacteriota bacterium]
MTEQASGNVNPFHIQGMVRDESLFFGRKSELNSIWGYLRKGSNVSIVAPRRMGKSSLLWRIKEKAHDEIPHESNKPEIQIFYIDMELISCEEQFFDWLKELVKAQGPTSLQLERALENKRVILCIDEFDRTANNNAFSEDFFSILRGLSQGENLSLVIASKIPLIEYAGEGMSSPLHNIFPPSPVCLGPLLKEEAEELLTSIAARIHRNFTRDEISKALQMIGNYFPWNVQYYGWCWFENDFNVENAGKMYNKTLIERVKGKQKLDWLPKVISSMLFIFSVLLFYMIISRDFWLFKIIAVLAFLIATLYIIYSIGIRSLEKKT